jgi:hypothetical protein
MNDVDLDWNGDISFGPTGDLKVVSDRQLVSQRVCRRLLTNSGEYLWQLDYGASLGQFVGRPTDVNSIEAVIRSQMALEPLLSNVPAADVSMSLVQVDNGIVSATIQYADPLSSSSIAININVPGEAL